VRCREDEVVRRATSMGEKGSRAPRRYRRSDPRRDVARRRGGYSRVVGPRPEEERGLRRCVAGRGGPRCYFVEGEEHAPARGSERERDVALLTLGGDEDATHGARG
jgi:hypothetical protein